MLTSVFGACASHQSEDDGPSTAGPARPPDDDDDDDDVDLTGVCPPPGADAPNHAPTEAHSSAAGCDRGRALPLPLLGRRWDMSSSTRVPHSLLSARLARVCKFRKMYKFRKVSSPLPQASCF